MAPTKTIEDMIIKKLKELPDDGKKEVLEYIERLKSKKLEATLRSLKKTDGAWKGLVDAEKLKADVYSDRLLSTRKKAAF